MYDFRNGKAGVGQEANWMVDISRRGNIRIKNLPFNWFAKVAQDKNMSSEEIKHALSAMEGTISLDRESSINLTSQDLKEYIEVL